MNKITQPIDYPREFIQHIQKESLVPVISNGFRLNEIFHDDVEFLKTVKQVPDYYDEVRTIDQQVTKSWAREIVNYPMSDNHNLARVAQYHQVLTNDPLQAKSDYLSFINERLLKNYQDKKGKEDIVSDFRKSVQSLNFSLVAHELDVPEYPENNTDPLRLLAQLPLPIYITTSYFSFIERALKQEGKKPITQYWHWGRDNVVNTRLEYLADTEYERPTPEAPPQDLIPTVMQPVVYHLFGIEDIAETLVMSEDDYLNFLMEAPKDAKNFDVYPEKLRSAILNKRLLLMGYNLRDWDFRALIRFLSQFRGDLRQLVPSIAIQLKPTLGKREVEEVSLKYLEKFFGDYKFNVKWIDEKQFIYELFSVWKKITKGEQ